MAQYAIPDADLDDGTWLDDAASNIDLFASIAPDTPGGISSGDDTDWITSVLNPTNAPVGIGLSTIGDPVASTGHIMRWRRAKDAAGGGTIGLVVELRQGYVNEGTPGSLINGFTDANLSETIGTTTDTLTGGEADTITNYADLQVRLVANQT